MDTLPAELRACSWEPPFSVPRAATRCPEYTKEWRDARLCCRQAAAKGRSVAFLLAPIDIFLDSLELKEKLMLPTYEQQVAAMIELQKTNAQRRVAMSEISRRPPAVLSELSTLNAAMLAKRNEIELGVGMARALCKHLELWLARPWTESHLNLIVKAFAHTNADMRTRSAGPTVTRSAPESPEGSLTTTLPKNLISLMKSHEAMITQKGERERAAMARLAAGGSVGDDWILRAAAGGL